MWFAASPSKRWGFGSRRRIPGWEVLKDQHHRSPNQDEYGRRSTGHGGSQQFFYIFIRSSLRSSHKMASSQNYHQAARNRSISLHTSPREVWNEVERTPSLPVLTQTWTLQSHTKKRKNTHTHIHTRRQVSVHVTRSAVRPLQQLVTSTWRETNLEQESGTDQFKSNK